MSWCMKWVDNKKCTPILILGKIGRRPRRIRERRTHNSPQKSRFIFCCAKNPCSSISIYCNWSAKKYLSKRSDRGNSRTTRWLPISFLPLLPCYLFNEIQRCPVRSLLVWFLSHPSTFIGYPVNPKLYGFLLKTCGNDIPRGTKTRHAISNRTALNETENIETIYQEPCKYWRVIPGKGGDSYDNTMEFRFNHWKIRCVN